MDITAYMMGELHLHTWIFFVTPSPSRPVSTDTMASGKSQSLTTSFCPRARQSGSCAGSAESRDFPLPRPGDGGRLGELSPSMELAAGENPVKSPRSKPSRSEHDSVCLNNTASERPVRIRTPDPLFRHCRRSCKLEGFPAKT